MFAERVDEYGKVLEIVRGSNTWTRGVKVPSENEAEEDGVSKYDIQTTFILENYLFWQVRGFYSLVDAEDNVVYGTAVAMGGEEYVPPMLEIIGSEISSTNSSFQCPETVPGSTTLTCLIYANDIYGNPSLFKPDFLIRILGDPAGTKTTVALPLEGWVGIFYAEIVAPRDEVILTVSVKHQGKLIGDQQSQDVIVEPGIALGIDRSYHDEYTSKIIFETWFMSSFTFVGLLFLQRVFLYFLKFYLEHRMINLNSHPLYVARMKVM